MLSSVELLNLLMGTSISLLGVALTVLALVPLVTELIGGRYKEYFAARQKMADIRRAVIFLFVAASVLFLNVVLLLIVAVASTPDFLIFFGSVALFFIGLCSFGVSAYMFGSALWGAWNE